MFSATYDLPQVTATALHRTESVKCFIAGHAARALTASRPRLLARGALRGGHIGELQLHHLAASLVDPLLVVHLAAPGPRIPGTSAPLTTPGISPCVVFDDKMIYAYQYENLAYATDDGGNPIVQNQLQQTVANPQARWRVQPETVTSTPISSSTPSLPLVSGFQVYAYGLNLNNEVFGFYNGSLSTSCSASTTSRRTQREFAGTSTTSSNWFHRNIRTFAENQLIK